MKYLASCANIAVRPGRIRRNKLKVVKKENHNHRFVVLEEKHTRLQKHTGNT